MFKKTPFNVMHFPFKARISTALEQLWPKAIPDVANDVDENSSL